MKGGHRSFLKKGFLNYVYLIVYIEHCCLCIEINRKRSEKSLQNRNEIEDNMYIKK